MRATSFTHVSIHANDLEESTRFYVDVFGMRRVPAPDFEHPVVWLELGDQQLHLFLRDTSAPEYHHIGIEVDDFEAAYKLALERGLFDKDAWSPNVRELNDGAVQMYLRDPAGNLVEVNWPDASTLDRSVVTAIRHIADERPQSAEAQRASLYPARVVPS
jgi:catechol 2,3-dioxygenase-like lactoylglutathione lyase family enzyme